MSRKQKVLAAIGLLVLLVITLSVILSRSNIPVMEPAGPIAAREKHLIVTAFLLSMIVVIPVYLMLAWFAWNYRSANKSARYQPGFSHSRWLEGVWWAVPLVIITILAVMTWNSSHELDPFKPISSSTPPLKIQVISMRWKWLFIYPQQGIASVNYVNFPVNTPVDFQITSDAPMNSFWIPQLGGQIYAMSGMATHLNLMADKLGTYRGLSANISGNGFAGMHFAAVASTPRNYESWLNWVRSGTKNLDSSSYASLSKPSFDNQPQYFAAAQHDLFENVVNKYADSALYSSEAK